MSIFSRFNGGDPVARALKVPGVAQALAAAGRSEADLQELQDRLVRSGVETSRIAPALANAGLVRWFFSLPDPAKISLDHSLELINWARYGTTPRGLVPPS